MTEEYQKLLDVRAKIFARREGKPLEPAPEELIHQMRSERTSQLMQWERNVGKRQ